MASNVTEIASFTRSVADSLRGDYTQSMRIKLLVILFSVPFAVQAQTYKCKQADGSMAYQDSKCAADSSTMKVTPASPQSPQGSKATGPTSPITSDSACQDELLAITSACGTTATLTQCFQQKLSPGCWKQVSAENGTGTADASCIKEIQAMIEPCGQMVTPGSAECIQQKLSAACKANLGAGQ